MTPPQTPEQERLASELADIRRRVERMERQLNPQPWSPTPPDDWQLRWKCYVCQKVFDGAYGYVCSHTNCPTRATASSAIQNIEHHQGSKG